MKTLKKAISLTMSVVMLITATPVLPAAEFSTALDMEEIKALKAEISASMPDGWFKTKKKTYEGLPDAQTIEARYKRAVENNKKSLEAFKKDETAVQEYKKYLSLLQEEVKKKTDEISKHYGNSEEEISTIALYTVLYDDMVERADHYEDIYGTKILSHYLFAVGGGFLSAGLVSTILSMFEVEGIIWYLLGTGLTVGLGIFLLADPSVPYFKSDLTPDEVKKQFLINPFSILALFNKAGASDFEAFYNKSEDCAKVLNDVVDIEYYVSINLTVANIKDRIYVRTGYWYNLDVEEKTEYLHNLAERLRAEAKAN